MPKISYLSVLKLIPVEAIDNNVTPLFYFRIFLDYQFRSIVHPQLITTEQMLDLEDEILLRASHIKPYMVCINENNEKEALDYLNGLALTPTYDWLFDQGYITFLDDGRLICGTRLSRYTWEKLNINPNAKNRLRIFPE